MFGLILSLWAGFKIISGRRWAVIPGLIGSGVLALLLSAFYVLPVAVESPLVALQSATTEGYYNYQLHYTNLHQLFISRFWGYGASVWSDGDGMSFSAGQVQAVLLAIALLLAVVKKNITGVTLSLLAIFCLFLTHGKSEIVWKTLFFLSYIQFPWRFLAPAAFFISLSIVFSVSKFKFSKLVVSFIAVIAILTNIEYFRPDIWHETTDEIFFSGKNMEYQMQAHKDFWPKTAGSPPQKQAPTSAYFTDSVGEITLVSKKSASIIYQAKVIGRPAIIVFPTVYFPGWTSLVNGAQKPVYPDANTGLISVDLPAGEWLVELKFVDTWPRTLGNVISAATFLGIVSYLLFKYEKA